MISKIIRGHLIVFNIKKKPKETAQWNLNRSSLRPRREYAFDLSWNKSPPSVLFATLFTQSVRWWSRTNDGTVKQKEKYGIFSVQWAIKAIIWELLFGGSAPPRYQGERSGIPGRAEQQHQSNENQKYGAINTGESIRPLLSTPNSLAELRKTPRNLDSV